jgi:hypothetical protein
MAQNTISDCLVIRKRLATQADAYSNVAVGDVITEVRCGNAVWAGPSEETAMEFAKRWLKYVEVADQ